MASSMWQPQSFTHAITSARLSSSLLNCSSCKPITLFHSQLVFFGAQSAPPLLPTCNSSSGLQLRALLLASSTLLAHAELFSLTNAPLLIRNAKSAPMASTITLRNTPYIFHSQLQFSKPKLRATSITCCQTISLALQHPTTPLEAIRQLTLAFTTPFCNAF
jgi:hypothetical protein